MRWALPVAALVLLLGGACDETDVIDVSSDDDASDDDAGDDDTEEPCVPTIEWGFGGNFEVGQVVGNWSLSGYADANQDGAVEQTEIPFDLEAIHCAGYQSVAIVAGDST